MQAGGTAVCVALYQYAPCSSIPKNVAARAAIYHYLVTQLIHSKIYGLGMSSAIAISLLVHDRLWVVAACKCLRRLELGLLIRVLLVKRYNLLLKVWIDGVETRMG